MKFVDLEDLVSEEAVLEHLGVDHILVEPNGYKWAEFNNRIEELKEDDIDAIVELKKWLITTIIPTLDQQLLTPSDFVAVSEVCQIVFNGGIQKLGKKLKPLSQIIKVK